MSWTSRLNTKCYLLNSWEVIHRRSDRCCWIFYDNEKQNPADSGARYPAPSAAPPANQKWRDGEQSSRYPLIGFTRAQRPSLRPLIGRTAGRMVVWCDVSEKVHVSFLFRGGHVAEFVRVWQDPSIWLCPLDIFEAVFMATKFCKLTKCHSFKISPGSKQF